MNPWRRPAVKWLIAALMLLALAWWVQDSIGWITLLRPWLAFPPGELLLLVILTALSYLTRAARLYDQRRRRCLLWPQDRVLLA